MSYWYLATPYTNYSGGVNRAWEEACRQTAFLLRNGIHVFSPIAHSHPIAHYGLIEKTDHDFWLRVDESMMGSARGMIQCRLPGWSESKGMQWEQTWFNDHDYPILPMTPYVIPDGVVTP